MIKRHGLFFASCLLAFTAGHMFNYTVILYLQERVGSDLLSGLGFGLAFGSSIVFGWFAGVLCDRVAPGRVIHGAHVLFLLGLACLFWAENGACSNVRTLWTLIGAFCGGLGWSFVGPARLTALGQIVVPEDLRAATIVFNLQVLLGFGLAPLLIGLIRARYPGWNPVLGTAAFGFIGGSVLILSSKTHAVARLVQQSVRRDLAEGFAAVRSNPLLAQLMLAAVIAYALTGPMQILLPKLARQMLGLSELERGAYLGLLALALICGGVLALVLAKRVPVGAFTFGGIMGGGIMFGSLAFLSSPLMSAVGLVLVGLCGGFVISLIVSNIQVQALPETRGRVMAMYSITSQVMPALSGIFAGVLVNASSVAQAIPLAGGLLALVALLGAVMMPDLRRLKSAG